MNEETKAIVSVSDMARMVGLSRARFYQLVRSGVFPAPVYQSGRPVYTEEMQQTCLEIRRRNCGMNGKAVLFYPRRRVIGSTKPPPRSKPDKPKNDEVKNLVDGLNALGLTAATGSQVEKVTKELFPNGTASVDHAEVLRAVFLHLKRQNSADNLG